MQDLGYVRNLYAIILQDYPPQLNGSQSIVLEPLIALLMYGGCQIQTIPRQIIVECYDHIARV